MKVRSAAAALKEAVRRWGKNAGVRKDVCYLMDEQMWQRGRQGPARPHCLCHPSPCPGGLEAYKVGVVVLGVMFSVRGSGGSWDEAFADADAHKDRL